MIAPWRLTIRKPVSIAIWLAVVLVLVSAFGQEPAQTIRGTWIVTAGHARTLHGTWSGRNLPQQPNVVEGSWTLADSGRIVIRGTWRAEKSSRGWQGHWTAETSRGESLAGAWGADVEHWHGKSLQDLLVLTLREEVSGWWQIGRQQGNWWLKGSQPQVH